MPVSGWLPERCCRKVSVSEVCLPAPCREIKRSLPCCSSLAQKQKRQGIVYVCAEKACCRESISMPGRSPIWCRCWAVLACAADGRTVIHNAGRLRIKESDRLQTVYRTLRGLGADIEEQDDGLIIEGRQVLRGGTADACGDHRIAMMAAVASLICREKVVLTGSAAVRKSYPDFFAVMEKAGLSGNLERR